MEMLIQTSRGELINIRFQFTDTFNNIKERMLAEYGVEMDFANLCRGKEIHLNDNILHFLKGNKQNLAVNIDHRLRSQFALNQSSIVGPSTTVIFGTIMLEPKAAQPDEIYTDEDESMITGPPYRQDTMEVKFDGLSLEQAEQRCRLCSMENHEMIPIFGTAGDHDNLAGKIRVCFSIIVQETDMIKRICQSCIEDLRKYHEFREKVLKANEKFGNSGNTRNNRRQRDSLESVCFTCCRRFPSSRELEDHYKGNENERIWKCNMCIAQPSFTTKCSLGQHQIIHKEITMKCISCGTRFANLPAYIYHIEGDANYREFDCHVCNTSWKTKCALSLHELTHTRKSEHECLSCGGQFATSADLGRHMQGLEDDTKLHCHLCNAFFRTKCALTTHKIIHPETCQSIYSCPACGKTFMEKTAWLIHVNTHRASKSFRCNFCSRSFRRKLKMEKHQKLHGKDRCPECRKCFTDSARLREHMESHIVGKPFICNLCGKVFKGPHTRKMHMTIHAGEKAIKSDIGSGSFNRGGDMRNHKILMHNL